MADRPRTPVLYVHHRSELGGAPASLSYLIRELDSAQVRDAKNGPDQPKRLRKSSPPTHRGALRSRLDDPLSPPRRDHVPLLFEESPRFFEHRRALFQSAAEREDLAEVRQRDRTEFR